MDYPEYEQYPTCTYCGGGHWGFQCQERNSYPPHPQNAYFMNSNHRNYHRNTQHSFNFRSGQSFEPNCYSNNFCRYNRKISYQEPDCTRSTNYYEDFLSSLAAQAEALNRKVDRLLTPAPSPQVFSREWDQPYANAYNPG